MDVRTDSARPWLVVTGLHRRRGPSRRPATWYAGVAVVGVCLLCLVVLPVAGIAVTALSAGWRELWAPLQSPIGRAALGLSLAAAFTAAVVNTVAGTLLALALERTSVPGRGLLNALVDLPLAIPTTVAGLMLLELYSPVQPVGRWLAAHHVAVAYARAGVVLAMVFVTLPYAVRSVQPLLESLDRRAEEAAWTLGAGPWRTFWRVVLPALAPGVVSGFFLTFSRAVAEFGAVVVISGNLPLRTEVAPVYLYGLLENDDPAGAAAVSLYLLAASLLALAVTGWLQRRWGSRAAAPGGFAGVESRGRVAHAALAAGRWPARRWAFGALAWLWWGLVCLLPVAGLAKAGLAGGVAGFWAACTRPDAVAALRLSAWVTAWTTLLNLVLGLWTAVLLSRHRFRGRRLLAALADLPFALSPVIAGASLLVAYGPRSVLGGWLSQAGVRLMFAVPGMVLATLMVTYPMVVRELVPVLAAASRAQEEAAWTLGGGRGRPNRRKPGKL
ncbi:MAG: sulfate ABC transporter permease subunit [Alicyclobacillaceae bacterium]|nr:sulfate ABC transporter permease subunit [Alicyclobacillaceae bacterium]